MEESMTRKQRMVRILEGAAEMRNLGRLDYDVCDMIWCAMIRETNANLANAEWQLGLPVLEGGDGRLDQRTDYLHTKLSELH
jgi:hypothetical protein